MVVERRVARVFSRRARNPLQGLLSGVHDGGLSPVVRDSLTDALGGQMRPARGGHTVPKRLLIQSAMRCPSASCPGGIGSGTMSFL